ncbi:hypothetical protein EVAR_57081_1 [Eumeta japonica]|uniref:Uncharacterized protein n=1 Tax=Eumeta variegata TaxID=151549 RepID=A0A4C1Z4F9_EUMVA|nr:hypothetical protein EVAR_57081_1 [Eumeta japonica]
MPIRKFREIDRKRCNGRRCNVRNFGHRLRCGRGRGASDVNIGHGVLICRIQRDTRSQRAGPTMRRVRRRDARPCDWKGIIHYELLPPGKTINSNLYCQQLMRLKQEVVKKRPKFITRKLMAWLTASGDPPRRPLRPLPVPSERILFSRHTKLNTNPENSLRE